jgi:hypothetical protein
VETKDAYVKSEPGPGSTEQYLSVLPLSEVPTEVSPGSLGDIDLVSDEAVVWTSLDALPVSIDILDCLLHVTLDIEGETGCLWDGKTEVEGDAAGNASETDEETPAVINSDGVRRGLGKDGTLVGGNYDECDERCSYGKVESMPWRTDSSGWKLTY